MNSQTLNAHRARRRLLVNPCHRLASIIAAEHSRGRLKTDADIPRPGEMKIYGFCSSAGELAQRRVGPRGAAATSGFVTGVRTSRIKARFGMAAPVRSATSLRSHHCLSSGARSQARSTSRMCPTSALLPLVQPTGHPKFDGRSGGPRAARGGLPLQPGHLGGR